MYLGGNCKKGKKEQSLQKDGRDRKWMPREIEGKQQNVRGGLKSKVRRKVKLSREGCKQNTRTWPSQLLENGAGEISLI